MFASEAARDGFSATIKAVLMIAGSTIAKQFQCNTTDNQTENSIC